MAAVLYVEVVPTTKNIKRTVEREFSDGFRGVEHEASGVFGRIAGFAKGAATAVTTAAAALAGLAIKGGLTRLLNIEDAQAKLSGLGHDAAAVTLIMDNALQSVLGTIYSLDDAATIAASAVAAGIKPGQELERYLKLTADAAAIAKTSMGDVGQVFNQVMSAGRVYTQDMLQLTQRGIPIFQWLAEEYGITSGELRKMVEQGEVDSATFLRAIENNIGGAALSASDTTRGAFANMMTALSRTGANLLSGVFPLFREAFLGIRDYLDALAPSAQAAGEVIGRMGDRISAGLSVVSGGLSRLRELLPDISGLVAPLAGAFAALGAGGLAALVTRLPFLSTLFGGLAGPLAALAGPVGIVLGALAGLVAVSPALQSALGGLVSTVFAALGDIAAQLAPTISALLPQIAGLAQKFGEVLATGVIEKLIPFLSGLVEMLGPVLATTLERLTPVLTLVLDVFAMLLDAIAPLVGVALPPLLKLIGALLPVVLPLVDILAAVLVPVLELVGWVIETVVAPVLQFLVEVLGWVIDVVADFITGLVSGSGEAGGAFEAFSAVVGAALAAVGGVFTWIYETIIKPVFDGIAAVVSWVWTSILQPIFTLIAIAVGLWAAAFQWAYENVIQPVMTAIGALATWLYANVIEPVFALIGLALTVLGAGFSWLYANAIRPAIDAISAGFTWLWENAIRPVADLISAAVETIGTAVGVVFGAIGGVIRGAFDGVVSFIRGIFNSIIDLVNGVIRGVNTAGKIAGDALGMDLRLSYLPRLANGGLIAARPGGVPAIIGEGRHDEIVMPLAGPVLDRIRDALWQGRDSAIDPLEIARSVAPVDFSDESIEKLARAIAQMSRMMGRMGIKD